MPAIKNSILASLPDEQYQRILPRIEEFEFAHGRIIYEIDGPIDYVYFPNNALVSLVKQMVDDLASLN
ncbi:MAG TPA: hypothetical protein VMM84_10525 [Pyrinomonadaceae bacterium]|nr:hypothetical protein [Pyrinomonadaceae bacterium]